MWISDKWEGYELLDCADGERLERWADFTLIRPDPQVIWKTKKEHPSWYTADARYERSSKGGGKWSKNSLPALWQISYRDLKLNVNLMNFKHTGVFPEQAANWDFSTEMIGSAGRSINVLNLFAYTGAATLAAAAAGAQVCHVDAASNMVARARENAKLSNLSDRPIRWIVDDCTKFIEREVKRGRKYDAIIMDPPSYGRGPSGEVWKLEDDLYDFLKLCSLVISDEPLFVLINAYTTGLSASTLSYLVKSVLGGKAVSDELGLPVSGSDLVLPCGAACRWTPS